MSDLEKPMNKSTQKVLYDLFSEKKAALFGQKYNGEISEEVYAVKTKELEDAEKDLKETISIGKRHGIYLNRP